MSNSCTPARSALTIRPATSADVDRLVDMAIRFLATTHYGALVTPNPQALGVLIAQVLSLGAIFVADVDRRPAECAYYAAPFEGKRVDEPRCRNCGAVASLHGPYVVGMLALFAAPHPLSGDLYADELAWWVEPEYRASSIGPRLLKRAEEWATERGIRMLKMVAPFGSDVGRFYERHGYTGVETVYQKTLLEKLR